MPTRLRGIRCLQAVLDNRRDVVVRHEYLDKPVDPERLCVAVAKVLDRSG